MPVNLRPHSLAGWFLLIFAGLLSVNFLWVRYTTSSDVQTQISSPLTQAQSNKTFSLQMLGEIEPLLKEQISSDLKRLTPEAWLPLQGQCSANNVTFSPASAHHRWYWLHQQVEVFLSQYQLYAIISLNCDLHWFGLVATSAAFSALLMLILAFVPHPVHHQQQDGYRRLLQQGVSRSQASRLSKQLNCLTPPQQRLFGLLVRSDTASPTELLNWCQNQVPPHLSPLQMQWFEKAFAVNGQKDFALEIALADERLVFHPGHCEVQIHGLTLCLAKTPFFYYLWYATKLHQGDGWQLNPATTKADSVAADELMNLMQRYDGHGKAIKDLAHQGLTAKKLDQNRNKIKEELIKTLGEELASPYLFESRRDGKTQRYWYRIVPQTLPALIK